MDARLELDEGIRVECVWGVGELFGQRATRRGRVRRGETQAPQRHPQEHPGEDLPSTIDDPHRAPPSAVCDDVRYRESMAKLEIKLHQRFIKCQSFLAYAVRLSEHNVLGCAVPAQSAQELWMAT
jgi:hypothetical protein